MAANKLGERFATFTLLMPVNTAIASGQPLLFGDGTHVAAGVATDAQTANNATGPTYDANSGYLDVDFEGVYALTVVAETLGSASAGAAINTGDAIYASGGTYDKTSGITYGFTLCRDTGATFFGLAMQPLAAGTTGNYRGAFEERGIKEPPDMIKFVDVVKNYGDLPMRGYEVGYGGMREGLDNTRAVDFMEFSESGQSNPTVTGERGELSIAAYRQRMAGRQKAVYERRLFEASKIILRGITGSARDRLNLQEALSISDFPPVRRRHRPIGARELPRNTVHLEPSGAGAGSERLPAGETVPRRRWHRALGQHALESRSRPIPATRPEPDPASTPMGT